MENKNENKNNGIAELVFRLFSIITICFAGWAVIKTWGDLEGWWQLIMSCIILYTGLYFIMTR